jgi:hypothetical protein
LAKLRQNAIILNLVERRRLVNIIFASKLRQGYLVAKKLILADAICTRSQPSLRVPEGIGSRCLLDHLIVCHRPTKILADVKKRYPMAADVSRGI